MTSTHFYWITGFLFLLLSLHLLYPLIFKYIDNKPNGVQSIFDLVIRDHFMIGRFNGTVYCVIAIISRIDPIAEVLIHYDILAIIISSVYDFSFAFGCINTGCVCIFRIACLTNISFIEDLIGESTLRLILVLVSAITAALLCIIEIVSGDITTGLSFNIITRNDVPSGK